MLLHIELSYVIKPVCFHGLFVQQGWELCISQKQINFTLFCTTDKLGKSGAICLHSA